MDITMCKGGDCPKKEGCKRYISEAGLMQSYFLEEPFIVKDDMFYCDMLWSNSIDLEDVIFGWW